MVASRFVIAASVATLVVASCGGPDPLLNLDPVATPSDAGVADALSPFPCTSNAGCPTGTSCLFPVNAACTAPQPFCLPKIQCKGMLACSCTGSTVFVCSGSS